MELFEDLHVSFVTQHGVGHDHETGTAAVQTLSCYPVYEGSSRLSKPCGEREVNGSGEEGVNGSGKRDNDSGGEGVKGVERLTDKVGVYSKRMNGY